MNRRKVITLLGGAAATWPLAARAQQRERMRRIGVLWSSLAADDPELLSRSAFVQSLQERGWSDGGNVRIEYRWGLGDPDRTRKYAAELVALAPDVILAAGALAVASLQQTNRSVPIVFANVVDPVGAGLCRDLGTAGRQHHRLREYGIRPEREIAREWPSFGIRPVLSKSHSSAPYKPWRRH